MLFTSSLFEYVNYCSSFFDVGAMPADFGAIAQSNAGYAYAVFTLA
ncbi:MAG TPA: hypothetical protein VK211_08585 [Kamptonema sp.]|nr:hypothetical protein [Kamptonema sp.]